MPQKATPQIDYIFVSNGTENKHAESINISN